MWLGLLARAVGRQRRVGWWVGLCVKPGEAQGYTQESSPSFPTSPLPARSHRRTSERKVCVQYALGWRGGGPARATPPLARSRSLARSSACVCVPRWIVSLAAGLGSWLAASCAARRCCCSLPLRLTHLCLPGRALKLLLSFDDSESATLPPVGLANFASFGLGGSARRRFSVALLLLLLPRSTTRQSVSLPS